MAEEWRIKTSLGVLLLPLNIKNLKWNKHKDFIVSVTEPVWMTYDLEAMDDQELIEFSEYEPFNTEFISMHGQADFDQADLQQVESALKNITPTNDRERERIKKSTVKTSHVEFEHEDIWYVSIVDEDSDEMLTVKFVVKKEEKCVCKKCTHHHK